jgi:hypothetical protein
MLEGQLEKSKCNQVFPSLYCAPFSKSLAHLEFGLQEGITVNKSLALDLAML